MSYEIDYDRIEFDDCPWGVTLPLYDNTIFDTDLFQEMVHCCVRHEISFEEFGVYINNLLRNGYSEETEAILADFEQHSRDANTLQAMDNILTELKFGYYIYKLIDPRNNSVFYIGKGKDSRLLDHEIYAIRNSHYNSELQNRILEIKNSGEQVIYEIAWHGIPDSDEAFRTESDMMSNYGISELCNAKSGHENHIVRNDNIELLTRILHYFNIWSNRVEDFSELKINDKILLIYFISKSIDLQMYRGISASFRDSALDLGVNTPVIEKSIKRLIKYGFLDLAYAGKGCYASKYNITDKVLDAARELPAFPKCNDFEHNSTIQSLLQHDAFRFGGLNKSGLYIILQFILNPATSYTAKKLVSLTGLSRQTVSRAIEKLVNSSVLTNVEGVYSLDPQILKGEEAVEFTLEAASITYRTYGRRETYKRIYELQRYVYRRMRLRSKITGYSHIPVDEILLLEVVGKLLSRGVKNNPGDVVLRSTPVREDVFISPEAS